MLVGHLKLAQGNPNLQKSVSGMPTGQDAVPEKERETDRALLICAHHLTYSHV